MEGDITNLAIDAIVSNDDVDGRMYTLVASAVRDAAGQDVEDESMSQGPFPLGDAWNTHAGTLTSVHSIVHVAAVNRRGDTDIDTILQCTINALCVARENEATSLGLPAFGTSGPGPDVKGTIPLEEWLVAVGREVARYLMKEFPGPPGSGAGDLAPDPDPAPAPELAPRDLQITPALGAEPADHEARPAPATDLVDQDAPSGSSASRIFSVVVVLFDVADVTEATKHLWRGAQSAMTVDARGQDSTERAPGPQAASA
jgi:hypothetical protein